MFFEACITHSHFRSGTSIPTQKISLRLEKNNMYRIIYVYLYANYDPISSQYFFLYSLKSTENMWFSDAFRGYKGNNVAWNGKMFELVCCMCVIQ